MVGNKEEGPVSKKRKSESSLLVTPGKKESENHIVPFLIEREPEAMNLGGNCA